MLVTYRRLPMTVGYFTRGGGQSRRPDAPINDCHLLHCRRAGPHSDQDHESKIIAICTQEREQWKEEKEEGGEVC